MLGLLKTVAHWLHHPRYEIVEVVGGGPEDGELFWMSGDTREGDVFHYGGYVYRCDVRNGKRVWRFEGRA